MPPKTVVCSVCNQEVLKAQTLSYKDGRACRIHPGVEGDAQVRVEAEKIKREQDIKLNATKGKRYSEDSEHRRARELKFEAELAPWRDYVHNHCWVCERPGIGLQEFYFKALVAMKRLELRGEFNFFSMPQDVRNLMDGAIPLIDIRYIDSKDRKLMHLIKDRKLRDILHLLQHVKLCGDCVYKYGYGEQFEAMMPKPTWEQLMNYIPVMQVAIDPILKELAEKKEQEN